MSKFFTNTENGGVPIFYNDLQDISNNEISMAVSILKGNTSGQAMIINGCTVSNVNTGTTTLTIGTGEIFINNAILPFAGYTGNYPVYITETQTNIDREYFSGATDVAFVDRSLTTSTTAPATGVQYVRIDNTFSGYTFTQYLKDTLKYDEEDFKRTSEVTGAFFRKDNGGFVHLSGILGVFNESQELSFTLPVGYRPNLSFSKEVHGWAAMQSSNNTTYMYPIVAYIFVNDNGVVTCEISNTTTGSLSSKRTYIPCSPIQINGTNTTVTFTGYKICYLDGIQFKAYK